MTVTNLARDEGSASGAPSGAPAPLPAAKDPVRASLLERAQIWLAVRLAWRRPATIADAVRGFQATEADGVWHLQRGLSRVKDPRQRAIIFTHSLEEEAHAEAFAKVYSHYGNHALVPPTMEREEIYARSEPAWKLFAFVHVGEEDATGRFKTIRDLLDGGPLKDALGRVVSDEEGHIDLTHRMLLQLGASDREIRREVRRVRLVRLWEAWLRTGKRFADTVATVGLAIAYYVCGALLFASARGRLSERYVEYDNNALKRLVP